MEYIHTQKPHVFNRYYRAVLRRVEKLEKELYETDKSIEKMRLRSRLMVQYAEIRAIKKRNLKEKKEAQQELLQKQKRIHEIKNMYGLYFN